MSTVGLSFSFKRMILRVVIAKSQSSDDLTRNLKKLSLASD